MIVSSAISDLEGTSIGKKGKKVSGVVHEDYVTIADVLEKSGGKFIVTEEWYKAHGAKLQLYVRGKKDVQEMIDGKMNANLGKLIGGRFPGKKIATVNYQRNGVTVRRILTLAIDVNA